MLVTEAMAAGRGDVFDSQCPARTVLDHVTSKWAVLVLVGLRAGPLRYSALRRAIGGVSEKMLAQTLQALERDGFVHREAEPTIPPKVEYSLTPIGRDVAETLLGLIELVESRIPEVDSARARYDAARSARPHGRA